ncbi:methyltransferase, putative (macronuclear) [Tetrahymena thermophila SB210]|uniref:Ribosomal RNA-processing protein 8 n=1 Tax=Tetrahymena thermophila (strain SB210) TaxID=312017 RepID=W7X772_TETTS|nr:methyltransferase, putative [Tetrahymena thermophila SB210]EWS75240.1 methyltransferase, putative [Tetrahymena thermophila SB210]|eukprot:XP_012652231.1 methyltransferase, putative [Tetrahymena thermophila SB210]
MFNRISIGGNPKKDANKEASKNSNFNQKNQFNSQKKGENKNTLSSLLQKRSNPEKSQDNSSGKPYKQAQNNNQSSNKNNSQKPQNNQSKQNDQNKNKKFQKHEEKQNQKNQDLTNRIEQGLVGSKFRMINEYLYTTDSKTSADHFAKNKEDFLLYHQGFQSQIVKWPEKPVDMIINELNSNQIFQNAVIADLGCGDGKIFEYFRDNNKLKSLDSSVKQGMKEVHSFDLCAHKDFIKVADSKNIPLKNSECDVVVFCLALMGTNYIEFLTEANRLLKLNGHLIISEVNSRITDMDLFIGMIECLGFKLQKKILPNTYFCFLTFKKLADNKLKLNSQILNQNKNFKTKYIAKFPKTKDQSDVLYISQSLLKPCIYKKR